MSDSDLNEAERRLIIQDIFDGMEHDEDCAIISDELDRLRAENVKLRAELIEAKTALALA
jgi:hypothetical protein